MSLDLLTDSREGARWWHLAAESLVAVAALAGVLFLLRGSFALRRSLAAEVQRSARFETEAENWRKQASAHVHFRKRPEKLP